MINIKVRIVDQLAIRLLKDGKIVKEWKPKRGHTWLTDGKNYLRDMTTDPATKAPIAKMGTNGTGTSDVATTNSHLAAGKARFVGTWAASGAITNITFFYLKNATPVTYAEYPISSFSKPDGFSLEVTWDVTITGWDNGYGSQYLRNMISGVADAGYDAANKVGKMEFVIAGVSHTFTTTNSKPADAQARYIATATGYTGAVDAGVWLHANSPDYDLVYGAIASGIVFNYTSDKLEVTWDATF